MSTHDVATTARDGGGADELPTPVARARVAGALRDGRIVARRNLLHYVRRPRLLVFSTIQPVMFVLLFTYVFGGALEGQLPGGVDYVAFLLPGIFVQSTVFRVTQTAVGLAEDVERGVVDRFRSMPMSRSAVLLGRTLADLARSLAVVLLMVAVGYVIGFRFTQGLLAAIGSVLVVGLFGFAFSWIFILVGLSVPGAEAAQSAGFVFVFPLAFVSSVFVPVATMPGPLEVFARLSPITATADAARALAIGTGDWAGPTLAVLAWAVALLVVFVPLSVRAYATALD